MRNLFGAFWATLALAVLVSCGGAPPPAAAKGGEPAPAAALPLGDTAGAVAAGEAGPVPVEADDPTDGPATAWVTIVVFSDLECPFCARLADTLARLRVDHGDDVRIVWKHRPLPMHPHARDAAEIGQGVLALGGAAAYRRYHEQAFAAQKTLTREGLVAMAGRAGVDAAAVAKGLEAKTWAKEVDRDVALAEKLGVQGTPASFVNGVRIDGAQPAGVWKEIVEAARTQAKDVAARGVDRASVYARVAAANYEETHEDEPEPQAPAAPKVDEAVYAVPVAGSPGRGVTAPLLTIVEFSDFQCPFCKKVGPTLERIAKAYEGKVRVVWKHMPLAFHDRAEPMSELAAEARAQKGDAGFWAAHDALFALTTYGDAELEGVARAVGLDAAKAMAAVRGKKHAAAIAADQKLAASLKVAGTPHFFVNGRRLQGAVPFETWKPLLDAELARAEAKVAAGTPAAKVYDALVKDGIKPGSLPVEGLEAVAVPTFPHAAPSRGPANAKVVVVEFSDFQCPFCQRVEPTVDALLKANPDVRVEWRNLPLSFHQHAHLAAEAAREAYVQKGNAGFWKMHALLFANQRDEGGLERPALERYGREIGLDAGKLKAALDGHVHAAAVDAEAAAAEKAGVRGTPGFLVGKYRLSGAQPLTRFQELVDHARKNP